MNETQQYLTALFRPGETLCYASTTIFDSSQLVTLEEALELPAANFVVVNPINGGRNDHNVTSRRNFVIEFDENPKTGEAIPIESQLADIRKKGLPFNTLVYSGGKSVHAVVSLTEPVTYAEYKDIYRIFKYLFWMLDSSCSNPSRLTRVAGAERDGINQDLLELGSSISRQDLFRWFARFHKHIERCELKEEAEHAKRLSELATKQASGLEGYDLLPDSNKAFLEGHGYAKSRHARLVAIAFAMFELGCEYDVTLDRISRAADLHGITADYKRAGEAESIVNYVYGARRLR